ncbi:hypothetical protein [Streptomyces sp. NPDC047928]|uniref:hypothetical protein n=1 Tax=unclassified Streptomyces TaxID=2593676 RepID=UPI003720C89A
MDTTEGPVATPDDHTRPDDAPRRRPRGRTALLLAAAALLGVVGGTAVGYTIQADRAPTPLPALNQPGLAYPAKPLPKGQEPEPLSAADDRRVTTDGDLRKLLVPKPKGAEDVNHRWGGNGGWLKLGDYALSFDNEDRMFEYLVKGDFRRSAITAWKQDERTTLVELVQFRSGLTLGAQEHAEGQRSYMVLDEHAGNGGHLLKGTGDGRYYVYDEPETEPGYLPLYSARAVFHRGDVMVNISIFDSKNIGKDDIRMLAERQLGRL